MKHGKRKEISNIFIFHLGVPPGALKNLNLNFLKLVNFTMPLRGLLNKKVKVSQSVKSAKAHSSVLVLVSLFRHTSSP